MLKKFLETHNADDIILAANNPTYFGLDQTTSLALHAWLYQAVNGLKTRDGLSS